MEGEDFDESELFATFEATDDGANMSGKLSRKKISSDTDSEVEILRHENELLKKVLRRIMSSCQSGEAPLVSVVFFENQRNSNIEEIVKEFAKRGEMARRGYGGASDASDSSNTNDDHDGNGMSESCVHDSSTFCDGFALALGRSGAQQDGGENNLSEEDTKVTDDLVGLPSGSIQYFSAYCVDSFGSNVVNPFTVEPAYRYEPAYFTTLPVDENQSKKRSKATCFNCDGSHRLQNCTKPRNLVRISAKRREFMDNFSSPFAQEARYHADKEKQEKFQHFAPGKWTPELRKALGLFESDLPPFIYRMRLLGYPSGWLPSNHDSGIVIHGGEAVPSDDKDGDNDDHEKLVRFPGFNTPLPPGVKDLSREMRLPVPNPAVQLRLPASDPEDTPKRKDRDSPVPDEERRSKRKRHDISSSDMEIDDVSDDGAMTSESGPPGTEVSTIPRTPTNDPQSTATIPNSVDLEDGELPNSPGHKSRAEALVYEPKWWIDTPLMCSGIIGDTLSVPPPFPLRPLPLHKISQILPGEMNHISFNDRNMLLDPVFGNLQVRTGRYDRLKTILANRDKKVSTPLL